MNRDEAIAWLQSVGKNASARDWALGETIAIPMGTPDTVGEITVYPGILYVRPLGDGRWELHDVSGAFAITEAHADLESAVQAADTYVTRWEREHSKKGR